MKKVILVVSLLCISMLLMGQNYRFDVLYDSTSNSFTMDARKKVSATSETITRLALLDTATVKNFFINKIDKEYKIIADAEKVIDESSKRIQLLTEDLNKANIGSYIKSKIQESPDSLLSSKWQYSNSNGLKMPLTVIKKEFYGLILLDGSKNIFGQLIPLIDTYFLLNISSEYGGGTVKMYKNENGSFNNRGTCINIIHSLSKIN